MATRIADLRAEFGVQESWMREELLKVRTEENKRCIDKILGPDHGWENKEDHLNNMLFLLWVFSPDEKD